jgi:hypothetical protein
MGPIGCPETSVINYNYSLRNTPEACSSHLHRGGSLKSCIDFISSHNLKRRTDGSSYVGRLWCRVPTVNEITIWSSKGVTRRNYLPVCQNTTLKIPTRKKEERWRLLRNFPDDESMTCWTKGLSCYMYAATRFAPLFVRLPSPLHLKFYSSSGKWSAYCYKQHFSFGKYSIFLCSPFVPGDLNRPSLHLIFQEGCTLN